MFTLSSNGSHVSNTMGGKSKAFFRTEAWRYTISVENLAYKLKCIVYQAQIITENMHFYPLHTTSKVSFLGFWVWFCSAVVARGPGSLMAPYPESQGARHTLALSFAVSTSFNLPLPARGSEGSIYHIPKQKNTGREDSPPLHSGDFHTTTTPVDTVKTNKSAKTRDGSLTILLLGESPLNWSLSTSLCQQPLLSF